jgi:predicted nucleic acid-binding Zn ribbon protein
LSPSKGPKKGGKKKRPLESRSSTEEEDIGPAPIVTDHKHCLNCGVSISPDKENCSAKCQEEWDKMIKRKKFWNYLPFIGAAFLLVLYILIQMA